MEFLQVNLGNILTILTFLVGGLSFVYTIRADVRITATRLDNVERELSDLRKVVVEIARQEERMKMLDQRLIMQGQRIDEAQKEIRSVRLASAKETLS